ncbi:MULTISPECIES: hypothetical protein [unclassified Sporolactobacillus]|uniref:hypothetical protein n=1 Tax=unclassified Sporolactobacillus TaxID=2628533 RepID=UPI002368A7A9|nr:hypothetical protein [Sporolactobacillus sp. CQH2019]MDD9147216.1 hypothetical protein [Sporolactobacillus sp. CQH2019]
MEEVSRKKLLNGRIKNAKHFRFHGSWHTWNFRVRPFFLYFPSEEQTDNDKENKHDDDENKHLHILLFVFYSICRLSYAWPGIRIIQQKKACFRMMIFFRCAYAMPMPASETAAFGNQPDRDTRSAKILTAR